MGVGCGKATPNTCLFAVMHAVATTMAWWDRCRHGAGWFGFLGLLIDVAGGFSLCCSGHCNHHSRNAMKRRPLLHVTPTPTPTAPSVAPATPPLSCKKSQSTNEAAQNMRLCPPRLKTCLSSVPVTLAHDRRRFKGKRCFDFGGHLPTVTMVAMCACAHL